MVNMFYLKSVSGFKKFIDWNFKISCFCNYSYIYDVNYPSALIS